MKLKCIKVLAKDEIYNIHSATMELLSTLGLKVDAKDTRNILQEHGAEIDHGTTFVKIPESLVKEQLKTVPSSFKLYGANGSYSFEVNTNTTQFATIGTPVKIYDPNSKSKVRKIILDDAIAHIRIVDSLEHIVNSQIDLWPKDVKYTSLHTHCLYQWAKNSRKPYGDGCFGKTPTQDLMNMTSIVVGGEEELIKRPRLVGFFNPTSPLHLPQIMTNGLAISTKYKQPTIIAPEAIGGTTAPVTLAGLLTQTNAEIIGSIVLSQIYNSGAPVFFGTVSASGDMRTGNIALGSVETGLLTAGIAQLARFYNVPSRGPGAVTDSKTLDVQNGFERMQTLMLAAQAGINYITCAGTYESTLAESLELLVIDDELAGMVKRAKEGITVDENTIALDVIKKVATSTKKGTNFLSEKHTREHMKKELFIPKLADRNRRSTWRKKGSKDIFISAKEKVEQLLKNFVPPELDKDVEKQLLDYIRRVEKRTIEFYKKAEGISTGSIAIGDTEIKLDDS